MRYLTKSRFKLALECPVKLFYTGKDEYPDKKKHDDFLEALAEGGFQVGELAKLYYPGGIDIVEKGYDIPLQKTAELLKRDNVIIYEAAFQFENLFIRADILVKEGNRITLIEVKSKSFAGDDSKMVGARGGLSASWKPYLYDVAFQKYVISNAMPGFSVNVNLLLADKEKRTSVDGLNQKFFISRDSDSKVRVETQGDLSKEALGEEILIVVDVDDIVNGIIAGQYGELEPGMDFASAVKFYADHYHKDEMIDRTIGVQCSKCEFDCSFDQESQGLRSGYRNCWKKRLNWKDEDFKKPHIFEIWNFRRKQNLLDAGIYHLEKLDKSDVGDFAPAKNGGMSTNERQWLQIEMSRENNNEPWFDADGMREEMSKWKFPLHFIDFETSRVAIPFTKNRRPYEGIAFQFSHHTIDENGVVKHAGEYINVEPGAFPNYDFVRALKKELENDNGTIFRYAEHENSFLVEIWKQLNDEADESVPDRLELMNFIKTITHSCKDLTEEWVGERDMVDMLKLVKNYFYHISMKGSNSIKVVLPAVLQTSKFIKDKYSLPVYGAEEGIESLNFRDQIWYRLDEDGNVINPYKLLDPVFKDMSDEETEDFTVDESIASGGAAMTAYARMQFTRMSSVERERAREALLRYCELDTLAMVMIYEHWKDLVNQQ
ncbi:MAG TPA: DUF2779 domain-containing protein [Tenuifilaceae bacterium]|nr:DUF2779 domain-containing protein [Tenuifilaceae bacterium]